MKCWFYSNSLYRFEMDNVDKMIDAAISGDLETVKKYYTSVDYDVIWPDVDPLYFACVHGHLHIVKYIIEFDKNKRTTPNDLLEMLTWACINGHLNVVEYVVSLGADAKNESPIWHACCGGYLDIVKYLTKCGADALNKRYLCTAIENKHENVVNYLKSLKRKKKIQEVLS
jgi:ankyrin repeat protein